MGRHATVAGRQASSAAARSKVFTKLMREIMVASKLGGMDLNSNARLRIAVDKARENNMPKDNIERAIKKGAGELEGSSYEEITYECYGPGGTAFMVEVLTDNRNRTKPDLTRIVTKGGGTIAEMNSVAWMFKKKGVFDIALTASLTEDKIMDIALDAGAEDVVIEDNIATVYTASTDFGTVRDALNKATIKIERSGLELIPENTIKVTGETAKAVLNLIRNLDDQDDSQNVFHNADISMEDVEKYS